MSNENCCKENCDCREIEDFTDEELKNELFLRELRKTQPAALVGANWNKVEKTVKQHISDIAKIWL